MNRYASLQEHKRPLTGRGKAMRTNMTDAECRLWFDCLQTLPHRFRKQRPMGRFIVDFHCPELRLVIEVDGESHNSEEACRYDQERTYFLQAQGLTVLRFTNEQVLRKLNAVNQSIQNWIAHRDSVPPLRWDVSKTDRGEGGHVAKSFRCSHVFPSALRAAPRRGALITSLLHSFFNF